MFEIKSFGRLRQLTGITEGKIESLAAAVQSHYRSFDSKLGSGKWRHIDNPKPDLKSVQGAILNVLRNVELPEHMYGAKRGGSVQDHARVHENQPCILALDLRNCFPKTTHTQVHRVFIDRVGCSPTIARLLTQLCTLDHHLPQGAPSSGYLAHLALLGLFTELQKIARDHDLKLSMYVDDIALSGTKANVTAAMERTLQAIHRSQHGVRNKKKQLMTGDARQLTGIAIRRRIRAPFGYLEELENELVNAARRGTVTATTFDSLRGKIRWVRSIDPREGEALANIMRYVGSGDERHKSFAQTRPCRDKLTCLWRTAQPKKVNTLPA